MKKSFLFVGMIGLLAVAITSCVEHEVIPAPTPKVDLEAHFIGQIGGSTIEFTENVTGYYNESSADLYIFQGVNSRAVYRSTMRSNELLNSISIGHGPVYFDGSNGEAAPTLPEFNNFFSDPVNVSTPQFSNTGLAGIFVRYTDGSGRIWASDSTSLNAQNIEYTYTKQESDDEGDYNMFQCEFDCYLYSLDIDSNLDSTLVQNAVYKGWFKR